MMGKKFFVWKARLALPFMGLLLLSSCQSSYKITKVEGGRVEINSAFDKNLDECALAIIAPYKLKVDSLMTPLIGRSETSMKAGRPEGMLSNLAADVLRQSCTNFGEVAADIAVVNIGGIRNDLPEGDISYGDIYNIFPFENTLCIVSMKGSSLMQLFQEMAKVGGEGISGAKLRITPEKTLLDATINEKPIDENKIYRIATVDYLAEGNDGLTAFTQATERVCPEGGTIRQIFIDYVIELTRKGEKVSSKLDDRIIIINK